MYAPQAGIFALGDAAHLYLEFSLRAGVSNQRLVEAVAALHEPWTTVGGMNLVAGFRPELWQDVAPSETPDDARGFNAPIAGAGGFVMPATQSDLWLWFSGAAFGTLWDGGRTALQALGGIARLDRQLQGWTYRRSRDLTGFEDGTENPSLLLAPEVALVSGGKGAGASMLLFQQWRHEPSWEALDDAQQEAAMGRTKAESIELTGDRAADDSHVSRAKDVVDGEERKIFRRNVAYGDVVDFGTVFVGFSCQRSRLQRMLERMAGAEDGIRDAITRFATPLTGAYYLVPSATALRSFAAVESGPAPLGML